MPGQCRPHRVGEHPTLVVDRHRDDRVGPDAQEPQRPVDRVVPVGTGDDADRRRTDQPARLDVPAGAAQHLVPGRGQRGEVRHLRAGHKADRGVRRQAEQVAHLVMNMGATPPRSANRLLATIGYQARDASRLRARRLDLLRRRDDAMAARRPEADQARRRSPKRSPQGSPTMAASIWCRRSLASARRNGTPKRAARSSGSRAIRGSSTWCARASRRWRYQTADLLDALRADGAPRIESLLIDGGLTANGWAMQFLADICDVDVARSEFPGSDRARRGQAGRLWRRADRIAGRRRGKHRRALVAAHGPGRKAALASGLAQCSRSGAGRSEDGMKRW